MNPRPLLRVPTGRSLSLPVAALVMLTGSWLHWRYGQAWQTTSGHAWGADDAYKTYRYALNSWNAWEPVYNPGQLAVEGYSNPLYMLALVRLLALAGPNDLYDASVGSMPRHYFRRALGVPSIGCSVAQRATGHRSDGVRLKPVAQAVSISATDD